MKNFYLDLTLVVYFLTLVVYFLRKLPLTHPPLAPEVVMASHSQDLGHEGEHELSDELRGSPLLRELLLDPLIEEHDIFSVIASHLNVRGLCGRRCTFQWTPQRVEDSLLLSSLQIREIQERVLATFGVKVAVRNLTPEDAMEVGWNRTGFAEGSDDAAICIGKVGTAFVGVLDNRIFYDGGQLLDEWKVSFLLRRFIDEYGVAGMERGVLTLNATARVRGEDYLPFIAAPLPSDDEERAVRWVHNMDRVVRCMQEPFYKREEALKILLLGLLSGTSVHLHGPHGIAKTACANRLFEFVDVGAEHKYSVALSKAMLPEEVFGPVSLQKLKQDVFERRTEGYLPSCSVAFIDEVWNASGAMLNGFLTILNEKLFFNGGKKVPVPLEMFVTASTEEPLAGMMPLYDRFVLRVDMQRFKTEEEYGNLLNFLNQGNSVSNIPAELMVDPAMLQVIRKESKRVNPSPMVFRILRKLPVELRKKGIDISERRLVNLMRVLQVAAWTRHIFYKHDATARILLEDLPIMQYIVTPNPSLFPIAREVFISLVHYALSHSAECQEDNNSIKRLALQPDLFLPWITRPVEVEYDSRMFEHCIYDILLKK